jgi:2-dehydropantoate 2-reductase
MQRAGLRIKTLTEDFTLPVNAVADASNVPADLVILSVKSFSLGDVAPMLRSLAERGATILPLLNGVDIVERCESMGVPRASLLGGIARVSTVKESAGFIIQDTPQQKIELGELDGRVSQRTRAIAQAIESAGIQAEITSEIEFALWRKFLSIASRAALCGMGGGCMAEVGKRPYGIESFHRAVREAGAVGRACGVRIPVEVEDAICKDGSAPTLEKPSFVHDLERGGLTEIDSLSGTVSRLGRRHGVPTPVHDLASLLFGHTAPKA